MLYGFVTENSTIGGACLLVYAIYRSRDIKRSPSGVDMWGQIERFARASAKRSATIGEFTDKFKRKMCCSTINPKWLKNGIKSVNAMVNRSTGEIISFGNENIRDFAIDIFQADEETQREIIDRLYYETQLIILLVRDRLEREKTAGIVTEEDLPCD